MDGRDLGRAIEGMMVALFVGGTLAGFIIGGVVMWIVPFLLRHVHLAWK